MSSKVHTTEIKEDTLNSIELSLNAKGEYSYSLKFYSDYAGINSMIRDIEAAELLLRSKFRRSPVLPSAAEEAPCPIGTPLPETKKPRQAVEEVSKPRKAVEEVSKPRKAVEEVSKPRKAVEAEEPEVIDFDDFFDEEEDEEEEDDTPPPPKRTRRKGSRS